MSNENAIGNGAALDFCCKASGCDGNRVSYGVTEI